MKKIAIVSILCIPVLCMGMLRKPAQKFTGKKYFKSVRPVQTRTYRTPSQKAVPDKDVEKTAANLRTKIADIRLQQVQVYEEMSKISREEKKLTRSLESAQKQLTQSRVYDKVLPQQIVDYLKDRRHTKARLNIQSIKNKLEALTEQSQKNLFRDANLRKRLFYHVDVLDDLAKRYNIQR